MLHYEIDKIFHDSTTPVVIRDSEQADYAEEHTHDFIEIAVVRQGQGVHSVFDRQQALIVPMIKGDVFTILPGEHHAYSQCRDFRVYNICVRPAFVQSKFGELAALAQFCTFFDSNRQIGVHQLHLSPVRLAVAELQIRALAQALRSTRPSRAIAVELALEELLLMLYDESFAEWNAAGMAGHERLFQAIAGMEEHPEQKFDLEKTAAKAGMSVSGFSHRFKEVIGLSPNEYCLNLKLERARKMLEEEAAPVGEVALACGFYDGNYMVRLFKRRYKVTPGSYRNTYRLGKGLEKLPVTGDRESPNPAAGQE